jgi:phage terminase small subunit
MPAKLPTRMKALKGTLRGDRANAREPRPELGKPRPSRELALDVRREFDELVRLLAPLGVLTVVDGLALELGAVALAEYWWHEAVIREKGATYETTTPAGSTMIRPRPEVPLAADAWRRASAMLREYGLTAVSRARVEAAPPDRPDSRWAGLLGDPIAAFRRQRPASPSPRRPA